MAIALAMDAFAVSICIGVSRSKFLIKNAIVVGLYFGIFQGIMPGIGYILGDVFTHRFDAISQYIILFILVLLGAKMIYGALFGKDDHMPQPASLTMPVMIPLAIATSIDALAAGVSIAFSGANIMVAVVLIGMVTLVISAVGVKIGSVAGEKFKTKAEILGGVILIILGLTALL